MGDVLFQITEENLETGLRGYPVGYCTTSHVDPQKGLFYAGRPVAEFGTTTAEEAIYLLYHGKMGSPLEIQKFFASLAPHQRLRPETVEAIYALPRGGHPMKLFSSALLLLGMLEEESDYWKAGLAVLAKSPHLVACVINHHGGFGATPPPKEGLSYMENFVAMVNLPAGKPKGLSRVLELFHVLHADHGGGNLSTFVGKAVASGLEDMYGSLAAAMLALEGPRHGRANQDCLEFVQEVLDKVGSTATASSVETLMREKLLHKKLIFGFGHAVLRIEDPRAGIMYGYVAGHYADHPLVKIALLLREVGPKVLRENPKIADPFPNVDAISGTMLVAAGFPFPEYFTLLFGFSRLIGISRQIIYERCEARGGKGTPIVRPKYLYRPMGSGQKV
jgi:citrate synthase